MEKKATTKKATTKKVVNNKMTIARFEGLLSGIVKGDIARQSGELALSNKQKSNQLLDYVTETLQKDQLPGLIKMMKSAVERLPAGNTQIDTGAKDEKGETIFKTVKFRDVAKRKLVAAFNKIVNNKKLPKLVEKYAGQTIKFNDTEPKLEPKKAPPTILDRLEKIFGETLDSKGYSALLKTAENNQKRVENAAKKAAERFKANALNDQIRQHAIILHQLDYDAYTVTDLLKRKFGVTKEQIEKAM